MYAKIQSDPISVNSIDLLRGPENSGALVFFEGIVRRRTAEIEIESLFYESYKEMAESSILEILQQAINKYSLIDAIAIHRVGMIMPGEPSVIVAAWSEHRDEAFKACREIIDQIKSKVPIWKKDMLDGGKSNWHEGN
ncbi:MAG: molybdenum cofactor biosynthesis protein MoaE [Candidatus Thermoplasmatota archaeon]|nr:molybdenum cofactor biosynthesis protein MoaE [Candidatus Thermoplasmatota archaeon]